MKQFFYLLFLVLINFISSAQTDSLLNINTRNYDQKNIKLDLSFDFDEAKITGNLVYTFSPLEDDFIELILHSKSTKVQSIKNGDKSLKFSQDENHLFVQLEKYYKKNEEISLIIKYEAWPERGMYFFKPTDEFPEIPYQVWTQGQSTYNRHWYPAYDLPDDKLTSEIILTVPKDLIAVSNGNLISEKENNGTKIFHWRMDKPYSNYLSTVIVGDYKTVKEEFRNISLEYNLPRNWVEERDYTYGRTPQMMEFFSNFLAPYPYQRYAQTTVQDFSWGGMENVTATTLNRRIHFDSRTVPNYSADGLIAHELAHQWFGDLLTCETWDHIWLNEGLTTYMTDLWIENELGKDEFLYLRYTENNDYFGEELTEEPLEKIQQKIDEKIPAELGGGKAYDRGAAILNMLRFEMGDEKFNNSLRYYIKKHRNGTVVTEDLRKSFEEISGKNLLDFFNQWVYSAGFPEFEVSYSFNEQSKNVELKVLQTQKKLPAVGIFKTPMLVEVVSGSEVVIDTILITQKEETFLIPSETKPYNVRFNKNYWILCKVNFEKSFDELAYQLNYDDDVMGRIFAAEQLASHGANAVDLFKRAIIRDRFYGVKLKSVEGLKKIGGDDSFEVLKIAAEDFDGRVREAAVKALGDFPGKNNKDYFVNKLHNEYNYYVRGAAAYSIGKLNFEDSFDILEDALKYDSHRNIIRRGAFYGLKELQDPRVLPLVEKYTQYKYSYGGMHLLDTTALGCAMVFKETHREDVIEAVASALENPYFRTRIRAAELLAELNAKDKLGLMKRIYKNERRIVVREPLKKAIEKLEKNS